MLAVSSRGWLTPDVGSSVGIYAVAHDDKVRAGFVEQLREWVAAVGAERRVVECVRRTWQIGTDCRLNLRSSVSGERPRVLVRREAHVWGSYEDHVRTVGAVPPYMNPSLLRPDGTCRTRRV